VFAVERDPMAFRTFAANFIDSPQGSVRRFNWPTWLKQTAWPIDDLLEKHSQELGELRGKIDIIAGGPPCQGFSFAGRRQADDPRNLLFKKYLEMVRLVEPTAVVIENVPGMAVAHGSPEDRCKRISGDTKGSHYERLAQELDALGYDVDARIVDASRFGVPQKRLRLIVVGLLRKRLAILPTDRVAGRVFEQLELQRKCHLSELGLDEQVSVGDAISDLSIQARDGGHWALKPCTDPESPPGFLEVAHDARRSKSSYQKLMRRDLNGESMNSMRLARHRVDIRERFRRIIEECRQGVRMNNQDRANFGIRKHRIHPMAYCDPAPTITTLPDDVLHYSDPRILTVRECARIQSFPDWFVFKGKFTTGGVFRKKECPRYTQVGNAVPPLLAMAIAKALESVVQSKLDEIELNTSRLHSIDLEFAAT
jgi:DNA (cytosine-5)-methyltransferase 1